LKNGRTENERTENSEANFWLISPLIYALETQPLMSDIFLSMKNGAGLADSAIPGEA